jgi:hypothetical protein
MAYPNQSTFVSTATGSAWWRVQSGGQAVVCATTGFAFVGALQAALGLTVDRRWGPSTAAALAAALRSKDAPAALAAAVDADAGTQTLRAGSVAAAVWLLHRASIGAAAAAPDASAIAVPPDLVPPRWNQVPPTPQPADQSLLQCTVQGAAPGAPGPSGPPAVVPGPTRAPPVAAAPLPTGVAPPQSGGASVTWVSLAVVGALAAAGVGLVVWNTRAAQAARRTSRRRGRR